MGSNETTWFIEDKKFKGLTNYSASIKKAFALMVNEVDK